MLKRITKLILVVCVVFLCNQKVLADNEDYSQFITKAVNGSEFYATDIDGNDITELVLSIYENEGALGVRQYFLENYGVFGYTEIDSNNMTRSLEDYVTVSDYQYVTAPGTYYGTKEWRTRLTGTYYYNTNTGLITRTVNPSLYLDWHHFGTDFSPYFSNVRTSSYVTNQSYATFTATYTMNATFSESSAGVTGLHITYGSHTHSFTKS